MTTDSTPTRGRNPHPLAGSGSALPFGYGPETPSPDRLFGDLGFISDLGDRTGWNRLPDAEVRERLLACAARLRSLREVAEATARRGPGYQPGDAAHVLVTHLGRVVEGTVRSLDRPHDPELTRLMGAQFEFGLFAVPYYLPPAAGMGLAGSHPPAPELLKEIRLPFPSVLVLFGGPLRFGPADSWLTSSTNGTRQWDVLHTEGGALHGVVLCAAGDGRPYNIAFYLMSLGHGPEAPAVTIAGELRFGAFSAVAANAASIVSWGAWRAPDLTAAIDLDQPASAVRAAVRRGAFRRRAESGAPLGAHVIDLGRTFAGRTAESTTGGTVAPHLRRGHWRRARVGPREDWHYEGRWIAPTFVNADATTEIADVLYRLPLPPEGPPPDDDVEDLTT